MTTSEMYKMLRHLFTSDHCIQNSFMFKWESDIWLLTKSGLSVEIEIKVSRSDFIADFKKHDKHNLFQNHKKSYISLPTKKTSIWHYNDEGRYVLGFENCRTNFVSTSDSIPNRFYYACPEGLITPNDLPDYAGLIYVDKSRNGDKMIIKKAPLLHKEKKEWTQKLMDKYYWRKINAINEIVGFRYALDNLNNNMDKIEMLTKKLNKVEQILR